MSSHIEADLFINDHPHDEKNNNFENDLSRLNSTMILTLKHPVHNNHNQLLFILRVSLLLQNRS